MRLISNQTWLVFSLILNAMVFALGSAADTQQSGKIFRLGYLAAPSPPADKAFVQALHDFGYVEGSNITIEYRFAQGQDHRLPSLVGELIDRNVDVIVTVGTPAAVAAKQATSIIPIVMAIVADPVGEGLVASLARPGGNVTGLANLDTELSQKRLEILKEVVPGLSRVAILWNPSNQAHKRALSESEAAAKNLGLQIQALAVGDVSAIKGAFSAINREQAGALMLLADSLFSASRLRITELARRNRLPSMFWTRSSVEVGGLLSYGAIYSDLYRRAALFVDKILKGAKPAELPVEQPTKFELVINLKTAKQIGLTIPPNVLARADRVIR